MTTTTTSYFDGIRTLDELKRAYHRLAMENHPDRGGDAEVMKEVNAEYDRAFEHIKYVTNLGNPHPVSEVAEDFRRAVELALNCDGVIVELCGSWLWLGGDTYPHRETLKSMYRWSGSKRKWYWSPNSRQYIRGGGGVSMGAIRRHYGSRILTKSELELATA